MFWKKENRKRTGYLGNVKHRRVRKYKEEKIFFESKGE